MKFINAILSGTLRSLRSLKALLFIWLVTLIFISAVVFPLKKFIQSALGSSKATDLISESFNIAFFPDLGASFKPMMSGLSSGTLLLLLLVMLLYIFLNGGLFDSLRANKCSYKVREFLHASGKLFVSYLVLTILMLLMIIFTLFLVVGLPLIISRSAGSGSEQSFLRLAGILRVVVILILPVLLLVVDYARAWLASNDHTKVFKAIGYGFRATFRSFFSSYLFMLLMIVVQGLFVWLVSKILVGWNPMSAGGLFVLFLLTQALFFLRLFLRAIRYGGVTALYQS